MFAETPLCAEANSCVSDQDSLTFAKLNELPWKEEFYDSGVNDWRKHWYLDGTKATITNNKHGMEFKAGPKTWDDSHHAVLWTKQQFAGDVKIEYEYTRTDREINMVTILYIQATGSGKGKYKKDIMEWGCF